MARYNRALPLLAAAVTGAAMLAGAQVAIPALKESFDNQELASVPLLDSEAKQILGVSVFGAANGLYSEGRLSEKTHERASLMGEQIPQFMRDILSDMESASYNQAIGGQWSEETIVAYMDTLSLPKDEVALYVGLVSGRPPEEGLIALDKEVGARRPDILTDPVRWSALTELTVLGASYHIAMAERIEPPQEKLTKLTSAILGSGFGVYGPEKTLQADVAVSFEKYSEEHSATFLLLSDFGESADLKTDIASEAALDQAFYEEEQFYLQPDFEWHDVSPEAEYEP